jgi:putative aldouronate transport system permease protein
MQTYTRGAGSRVFDACNYGLLLVAGFLFFYPFWSLVLTSFSNSLEIQHVGLKFWNATWTIEPYRWVFEAQSVSIGRAYYNSVFRTVLGTGAILIVTFLTAYPLAKVRLPGRTPIMLYFVTTLFFSGGLIPTYLLIRRLGLIDTRLVYILPEALSVWYVIIARNFLMAIDDEMEEAALVDGAGYLTILTRIVMPLAKPIFATIALWASVMHWNAWFDALIYIRDGNKRVLQLLLHKMMNLLRNFEEFEELNIPMEITLPPASVQAVTVLVTIGPIILVYPFFQRYFVKGIMIGALK